MKSLVAIRHIQFEHLDNPIARLLTRKFVITSLEQVIPAPPSPLTDQFIAELKKQFPGRQPALGYRPDLEAPEARPIEYNAEFIAYSLFTIPIAYPSVFNGAINCSQRPKSSEG